MIKDPLAAHIKIHLQLDHRLQDASLHGGGSGSMRDSGVTAHVTRCWSKRIGNAQSVDGTPRIAACEPELNGIDRG